MRKWSRVVVRLQVGGQKPRQMEWGHALEVVRWWVVLKPVDRVIATVAAGIYEFVRK